MDTVLNGIDRIDIWKPLLSGKKIGIMTHAPAVTADYKRSVDVLYQNLHVTTLWGPEHGLDGVAQAGNAVNSSVDGPTGLPVYSMFKSNGEKFADTVKNVEAVVCDFCDIGCRFYTYISSMNEAMIECAKQHIPFFVLDRPNPVNGICCDGTVLEESQTSFVGCRPIPVRHGMTIGETARVFNEKFNIHCDLTVIPLSGWRRSMEFEELGRGWINPSPNMTGADCARIYTGTCFLEGTNVSEGRGTTHPYEIIGAPYIDPFKLTHAINRFHLPGISVFPYRFSPTFSKYAGETCGGVQFILTDRKKANCFEAGIRLLEILQNDFPGFNFGERPAFFDKLMGTDRFRLGKITADELIAEGREESHTFRKEICNLLLYQE